MLKDFKALAAEDGFSDDDLTTLARKYDVSDDAMRFRLINLNIRAQTGWM